MEPIMRKRGGTDRKQESSATRDVEDSRIQGFSGRQATVSEPEQSEMEGLWREENRGQI